MSDGVYNFCTDFYFYNLAQLTAISVTYYLFSIVLKLIDLGLNITLSDMVLNKSGIIA